MPLWSASTFNPRCRIGKERSRPLVRLALSSVAFLGFAGCASVGELEEQSYQRERTQVALDESVELLEKERGVAKQLQMELSRANSSLAAEKARAASLQAERDKLQSEKQTLEEQFGAIRKEHLRLKETHAKLETMSQETLAEVSELRQRNDSIEAEKRRIEDRASVNEKQVLTLTKEIDDVKDELFRTRDAVKVLQENGDKVVELQKADLVADKRRLEEMLTAQRHQVAALSQELVNLRADLTLSQENHGVVVAKKVPTGESLVEDFLAVTADRYRKALNGQIAWDRFDVAVVATAGVVFVGALAFLLFLVRYVRARWTAKRLHLEVDGLRSEIESLREAQAQESAAQALASAPKPAPSRSQSVRIPRAREAEEGDGAERYKPNEFSPIMRSSEQRKAPPKEPVPARKAVEEKAEASRAPAPAPAPAAPSRKIIGAWRPEGSAAPASAPAPAAPRPAPVLRARVAASEGHEEETGAQTQIISDFDLNLLEESGISLSSSAKSSKEPKSAPKASPAPRPASSEPKKGTAEEQELLNELKSIISKKFDKS